MSLARPAIFLDRDGVINEDRDDYVKNWSEFVWIPGALAALRELAKWSLPIVVISNHSFINRGLVTFQEADAINAQMRKSVAARGGRIDAVYVCPHRPDEICACRKPAPGLFQQAAQDLGLDLLRSFAIGDAASDMKAGRQVGCRLSMVLTGRGRAQLLLLEDLAAEVYIARDLNDAACWVRQEMQRSM